MAQPATSHRMRGGPVFALEKDKERIGELAVVRAGAQLGDGVSVTLLPGVEIREQSLVAAGVVVSSDIPAHKMARRDSREGVQETGGAGTSRHQTLARITERS